MLGSKWTRGGIIFLFVGLVASIVGTLNGFNSLFGWNGRHPIDTKVIESEQTSHTFIPSAGRRYTISLQVVFDREGLERKEGVTAFEAKLPLVVKVKDGHGTSFAEAVGWIDPNDPPNVLYNQAAHESMSGRAMPDLYVERLVGPFIASSAAPLTIEVQLGADRVGVAKVLARQLVIHDDATPPVIRNAFVVAGLGIIAFMTGIGFVALGWLRDRRPKKRLGGNPRKSTV